MTSKNSEKSFRNFSESPFITPAAIDWFTKKRKKCDSLFKKPVAQC